MGMSGNEVLVVVDELMVIFGREFIVGLGRFKVGDVDVVGILVCVDVIVGLDRSMELIDRVW